MKVAVFYYTQSGQALRAAESICRPLGSDVVYLPIVPQQSYPFPWNKDEFFDTFPETRLGLPPSGIEPIDFSAVTDADLVMIVGQSWFLSPSLPLQSFFQNQAVNDYLNGKPVVFVNVCRNMWLMTSRKVKELLRSANAPLVGQIVLQDNACNLVSALTIVRWLLYGKKEQGWLLPQAGVSDEDISAASRFGEIISRTWDERELPHLQSRLLSAGAIRYKPSVLFLEQVGHRMFGLWARFVRRKGGFRDPRRRWRINLFFYYLLTVLFLVSPFAQFFYCLTYPLRAVKRQQDIDCNL